jgi:hypothetical protein
MFRIGNAALPRGHQSEPYLGIMPWVTSYLRGISDPGPPDRGAAIAPPAEAGAPKPIGQIYPKYADTHRDGAVDYLPILRGRPIFSGAVNSI